MSSFAAVHWRFARFTALVLVVLASGCITIEEHYTFKKNGSGTMEYVMDMSTTKDVMDAMGSGLEKARKKKEKQRRNDSPLVTGSDERVKQLKGLEGIKQVRMKDEEEGYVQRISFAFKDLDALNRALNVLLADSSGVQQTFFHWEGNTLVRTNNQFARKLGDDMTGMADSTELTSLLESMKYKYSFKFQDAIGDISTAGGMTRENPAPKQVNLTTDWSVIMKDPKALDLRIAVGK